MVRPKKHLGQHFLIDENISSRIVDALINHKPSCLLEVGPGMGVLTKYLLEKYENFFAYDVDEESIVFLKKKYKSNSEKFILKDFLKESEFRNGTSVIGNFPYNISSQLFFKIWENKNSVDEVVCMVQKEVAQRISSIEGNKTYGILSVLLQSYYNIEYLFTVPPEVFNPPPKVQSGVIRLTRNQTSNLPCSDQFLKKVVKMAFGKRRKTLRNALKELDLQEEMTGDELFNMRAEQLSVSQFIALATEIEQWKMQRPLS